MSKPTPMTVVTVGPRHHGVVRHGRELAATTGVPHLHFADYTAFGTAVGTAALPSRVLVSFTDDLFGGSATAVALLAQCAQHSQLWLGMHDVPQRLEGSQRYARRRACYSRAAGLAHTVVVNSDHEAAGIAQACAAERVLNTTVDPIVIPLPVPTLPGVDAAADVPNPPPHQHCPVIGVFGFLYPGKGVEDVIAAAGAVGGNPVVRNIGAVADGHHHLRATLTAAAAAAGVEFQVTGHLRDEALLPELLGVQVPVVAHRHISASGSLHTWLGAGRRPIAVQGRYVCETARRFPGTLTVVDRALLGEAIAAALADPASTIISSRPQWGWAEVGRCYQEAWSR